MKISAQKDNKIYVGHMPKIAKIADVNVDTLRRAKRRKESIYYAKNGAVVNFNTVFL